MRLVYEGPHDEVEVAGTDIVAKRGEDVEVPPEIAGRRPSGEPGEDGYDAGEGLLAQETWRRAQDKPAKRSTAKSAAPGSSGRSEGGES